MRKKSKNFYYKKKIVKYPLQIVGKQNARRRQPAKNKFWDHQNTRRISIPKKIGTNFFGNNKWYRKKLVSFSWRAGGRPSRDSLHEVVRMVWVFLESFRLLLHALFDFQDGRRLGLVVLISAWAAETFRTAFSSAFKLKLKWKFVVSWPIWC